MREKTRAAKKRAKKKKENANGKTFE